MLKRRTGLAVLVVAAAIIGLVLIRRATSPERNAPAVLVQVRQLNQLATVTYTVQKVIGIREQKQPVGSESILLIVQATVQAGVDLAGMRAEDVAVRRDGTVVLRLPPPQVLNVAIDEKNTKVWDRSKTWWAPWIPYSLDLEQRARLEGIEAVRQAALENGILAQAQRNAETSIRGLLTLAGVKSVVVIPANVTRKSGPGAGGRGPEMAVGCRFWVMGESKTGGRGAGPDGPAARRGPCIRGETGRESNVRPELRGVMLQAGALLSLLVFTQERVGADHQQRCNTRYQR